MAANHITKVALVGAGGNSGSFMAKSLLMTGRHTVTALTRHDSTTKMADGLIVKKVDYSNHEALVDSLKGQEALVITLSAHAREIQESLIRAAEDAKVQWVLPNEWSPDTEHEGLLKDVPMFTPKQTLRNQISDRAKINFISIQTGFWYEWSLSMAPCFGFDFKNRKVTFFDEGTTKICTSTWPQVGRSVAAILSLPIKPDADAPERCLEALKNKCVYINSFNVSQQDIFESTLRGTKTTASDWEITKESSQERYNTGQKEIKDGQRIGFAKVMYTRVFFPDGAGDYESRNGVLNKMLGLPKEDLDEATARSIKRSEEVPSWA